MPINSLYNASNLSIEKALINLAVTNKVLQELNQCNKAIFTLHDKGIDVRDVVWDEDIESLVPCFPDISISCDILHKLC